MIGTAAPPAKTWRRAVDDLVAGWQQRELWGHLGWQDIRQRYRRSVLGPDLDHHQHGGHGRRARASSTRACSTTTSSVQLPYMLVGFIVWAFISGCILEGSDVFIANEGLIKHLPAPLSVHVYRLVWRQILFFAHNLIVYVVMLFVFPQHLDWAEPHGDPGVRRCWSSTAPGWRCCSGSSRPGSATSRRSRRASCSCCSS